MIEYAAGESDASPTPTANPGERQIAERPPEAEAERGQGPEYLSDHDERDAAHAVREPAEGKAGYRVENREGGSDEKTDLAVAHPRRRADGTDEKSEDGPVDERVDVNEEKEDYPVPGTPGRGKAQVAKWECSLPPQLPETFRGNLGALPSDS